MVYFHETVTNPFASCIAVLLFYFYACCFHFCLFVWCGVVDGSCSV